jgi:hypothetical protein
MDGQSVPRPSIILRSSSFKVKSKTLRSWRMCRSRWSPYH